MPYASYNLSTKNFSLNGVIYECSIKEKPTCLGKQLTSCMHIYFLTLMNHFFASGFCTFQAKACEQRLKISLTPIEIFLNRPKTLINITGLFLEILLLAAR